MKTLDQVESRTPISNLPFTISAAGSYYLTGNFDSTPDGDGITITASNVTLDLNGFRLKGTGSGANSTGINAKGGGSAILVGLVIKNGTIMGFGNSIVLQRVNDSTIENVRCSDSKSVSIRLLGSSGVCDGNSISHCHVSKSSRAGIQLYGSSGQCNGNSVTHCLVRDCLAVGIEVLGIGGDASGNVIANNVVRNITSTSGRAYGIQLESVEENRVEGNHVSGVSSDSSTAYGIYSSSSSPGNLIIKNSSFGADDSFRFGSNDTYGPEITLSGTITSTNPWANFSR